MECPFLLPYALVSQWSFGLAKIKEKYFFRKNYIEYIDGALSSIKFLKPRDERVINCSYWKLFEHIQKNKIQKWEEMKFYLEDSQYCKMKLILSYFGEKDAKNCGNCSVCEKKKRSVFGQNISLEIINILAKKPATIEELSIQLTYHPKDNLLENLIYLLDSGKVKMLNFRTYMLA